jgi:hypothetical protein
VKQRLPEHAFLLFSEKEGQAHLSDENSRQIEVWAGALVVALARSKPCRTQAGVRHLICCHAGAIGSNITICV